MLNLPIFSQAKCLNAAIKQHVRFLSSATRRITRVIELKPQAQSATFTIEKFLNNKYKTFQGGNFCKSYNTTAANMSQPLSSEQLSHFILQNDQPVVALECEQAFNGLTEKEKQYAHYLSLAAWHGGLVVLVQTSPESPIIYVLLRKLFEQGISNLKEVALKNCAFLEEEFQAILVYSSGIFTNMGNYKGFGDTKFIPNLPKEKFEALVKNSESYKKDSALTEKLWKYCSEAMYSVTTKNKQLGFNDKGLTTYFSANCTKEDADLINEFMALNGYEAYNSRLFKSIDETLGVEYEVRLASAHNNSEESTGEKLLGKFRFKDSVVRVTRGDYSGLMKLVVKYLKEATGFASNETEVEMLKEYINCFTTGSLKAHIDGSRHWIKDKGPAVETYIGFIETYRDPAGQRGEFEGFVAMVNKAMSEKFGKLVENAELFLPLLPWGSAFEKDKFLRPDFTSLDVITFSGSGIPAGINIPNYDEVRQTEGFKNVSLGNVIPASYSQSVSPFLSDEDQVLLNKHRVNSFELQVGLHELLGHGSGKLFRKEKDGKSNFDPETINPDTGTKIKSYYEVGETYDSKFTTLSSSYEECRAECVGIYLSINPDILNIFGFSGELAEEIVYVNWLSLLWAGLRGLEMYQPDHKLWGQAHSQARFVILRVALEAGEDFITITERVGSDGKPDLLLSLDRTKIATVGKKAIGQFLRKLQVYKSTGDIENAKSLYEKYSHVAGVGESGIPFEEYRKIVVARRQPRKMFVQVNTRLEGNSIKIINYPASHEGLITSWMDRFSDESINGILVNLFECDRKYFDI